MAISPKVRFEVFKRDSFTCQYCGKKAPDVVLVAQEMHIDHVEPRSKGGSDDILNLVTACIECNQGKSNRPLNEQTVLEKQRNTLEIRQNRLEQLQMIRDWAVELRDLATIEVEIIQDEMKATCDTILNENGYLWMKRLILRNTFNDVLEAVKKVIQKNGTWTRPDVEKQLKYLKCPPDPFAYTGGILKHNFQMTTSRWIDFRALVEEWKAANLPPEKLQIVAKNNSDEEWEDFITAAETAIEEAETNTNAQTNS